MFFIFLILFTTSFSQETNNTCGASCTWTLQNGTLTITGQSSMNEYDVVHYNYPPWFDNRANIENVIIGEGITTIGAFAFYGCYNLKSIQIPSSVQSINTYAVAFCTDLTQIEISETVKTIMPYAFRGCTTLAKLKYKGITEPAQCTLQTFYDCDKLTAVTVPSQYYMNSTSFCGQKTLNSDDENQEGKCGENCQWTYDATSKALEISGAGEIQHFAIQRTPFHLIRGYFTTVKIAEGIVSIGNYSFYNCAKINAVELPSTLNQIGSFAFVNCQALVGVDIPVAVNKIGQQAFVGCLNLTTITFDNEKEPECPNDVFVNSTKLQSVTVQSQYVYYSADFCGFKKLITENKNQNGICGEKCEWNYNSENNFLEIVGEEEMYSFEEGRAPWYLLKDYIYEIEVAETISTIGNYSFYQMEELETIKIAETVTVIGDYAFENCTRLEEVVYYGEFEPICSNTTFDDSYFLYNVSVPYEYEDEEFCGKEISHREEDNTAMIIGIVCGVVGGVLLICIIVVVVVLVFIYMKKQKAKKSTYQALDGVDENAPLQE